MKLSKAAVVLVIALFVSTGADAFYDEYYGGTVVRADGGTMGNGFDVLQNGPDFFYNLGGK